MDGRMRRILAACACLAVLGALSQCKNELFTSVKKAAKTIHLTSPNGGNVLVPGSTARITWEASFDETLSIELLKAGASFEVLSSGAPNSGSFDWQIPGNHALGGDFSLRIGSTKDTEITDASDGTFTISSLGITAPAPAAVYADGATLNIQWAGLLDSSNSIDLSLYKNSVLVTGIVTGTLNDGAYSWPLPGTLANGDDYTIRIANTASSVTADSASFAIVHSVTVTAPNLATEVLRAGASNTITWTPAYAGTVTVELLSGGSPVATLTTAASGGTYSWATPLLTYGGATYTVRVTTAAAPAKNDVSDASFTILNPPQNFAATDGAAYQKVKLSWTAAAGATSYAMYVASAPGGPYSGCGTTTATSAEVYQGVLEPTVFYYRVQAVANGVYSLDSSYDQGSASRFEFRWSFGSSGSGNGQLNQPWDIDVFYNMPTPGASILYVADTFNHRIQTFAPTGAYSGQWGSSGSTDGKFSQPHGLCVDPADGKVYVADTGNSRIQVFNSSGTFLSKWGSNGSGDGQFKLPWDVAVDSSYVYVADSDNCRIQKFTKAGVFQGWWGKDSVQGTGWHAPGTATNPVMGSGNGEFYWPDGVAVDNSGNVQVADSYNMRIQKFTSAGVHLQTISYAAEKVSFDQDYTGGHMYAIQGTSFVFYDPSGTFLGRFGEAGTGNGQFAAASGICVIPQYAPALANVYVADTNNNRIQVIWRWQ